MREIKFRAWDKENNRMSPFKLQDLWAEGHYIFQGKSSGYLRGEIMQYTGLHDKNGKEIYEGDIFPHNGMNLVVRYELGAFVGHWHGSNEYIFFDEFANDEDDIEIIGNVFENPELLEP